VSGPISLQGGCEHLEPAIPIDRRLLELVGAARPLVAVLPLAASRRTRARVAQLARDHWAGIGAAALIAGLPTQTLCESMESIERADVIVLPGGHPRKLMNALGASPLLERIRERWHEGCGLSGSSAGAMCLFERQLRLYPPNPLRLEPGFGLLSRFVAAPHFDRLRARHWAPWFARLLGGRGVLGLDESTGLVGHPGDLGVVGQGAVTVIETGVTNIYSPGEQVAILLPQPTRTLQARQVAGRNTAS